MAYSSRKGEPGYENHKAYMKVWYAKNKAKVKGWAKRYALANPERVREWARLYARKRRAANPEPFNVACRKWQRTHRAAGRIKVKRYKASKRGAAGSHTLAEWIVLCWASAWRCFYCGVMLGEKTATEDHKIPLSRGGSNYIDNIALACRSCNSSKWTKTADEFLARAVGF